MCPTLKYVTTHSQNLLFSNPNSAVVLSILGHIARCAHTLHKVCTGTYPTRIVLHRSSNYDPCAAFTQVAYVFHPHFQCSSVCCCVCQLKRLPGFCTLVISSGHLVQGLHHCATYQNLMSISMERGYQVQAPSPQLSPNSHGRGLTTSSFASTARTSSPPARWRSPTHSINSKWG